MDGLSAAASGIAVVSVAVQLAESFKKLCDFWKSIKEAPENIRAISLDLELLSSVLTQIAHETQHVEPDATLIAALNGCCVKVKTLTALLDEIEPAFASRKSRVRKWAALRAVMKKGELMRFQEALDSLKGTLLLALQDRCSLAPEALRRILRIDRTFLVFSLLFSYPKVDTLLIHRDVYSRLGRIRQKSLELGLATISHSISNLSVHPYPQIVGSNPSVASGPTCAGEEQPRDSCVGNVYMDQKSSLISGKNWSVPNNQTRARRILGVTRSVTEGLLGTIHATSTTVMQSSMHTADITPYGEEDEHEYKTLYTIAPAPWLVRLGFRYGLHLSFLSSTRGWKNTLEPFRPVPDEALIFEFCKQGNIPAVRSLLSAGHASVRDTDSKGYTPLHFAAANYHSELCHFLKGAGSGMTSLTYHAQTPIRLVANNTDFITSADLAAIFDTFRVLIDSMDFFEGDGEGWHILYRLCEFTRGVCRDSKANSDLLLWILQMLRFELKANAITSNYGAMLYWLLRPEPELAEAVDLLFDLGGSSIVDAVDDATDGYAVLHYALGGNRPDHFVSTILARRPNLHQVGFSSFYSPYEESPTSLALYSSVAFTSWLYALHESDVDFESFIDEELKQNPEFHDGWTKVTLLDLFTYGDRPDLHFEETVACSDCMYHGLHPPVQPYWQHLVERIKGRLNPYDPLPADSEVSEDVNADVGSINEATSSSAIPTPEIDAKGDNHLDNLDEASSKSESAHDTSEYSATGQLGFKCLYGKHEIVCMRCWLHYKLNGTRSNRRPPEDLSEATAHQNGKGRSRNEPLILIIYFGNLLLMNYGLNSLPAVTNGPLRERTFHM